MNSSASRSPTTHCADERNDDGFSGADHQAGMRSRQAERVGMYRKVKRKFPRGGLHRTQTKSPRNAGAF